MNIEHLKSKFSKKFREKQNLKYECSNFSAYLFEEISKFLSKMEHLFNDESKIKIFKQIQNDLLNLETNSEEEVIDNLINQIPKQYLENKEDLMTICHLFSYYARNHIHRNKGNAIRLFEKIINQIKDHLQNESSFLWRIFGGLYYFKLWMYEEGLISIEKIVSSIRQTDSKTTIEYFLPEIIEKVPEIFEKELKAKIESDKYSDENLRQFKELRKKHFQWLRNSNDYNDPIYREIEKDPLRYSLKTDDIETFQSIVSKTNMNINLEINESVLENFDRRERKMSLFAFSIEYQAINIFKYLVMNDAKIEAKDIYAAIYQRNYEMMHIIESKNYSSFDEEALISAVTCWNVDVVEYSIENYPKDYIKDDKFVEFDENNSKYVDDMKDIIFNTFLSCNFIFFDDYLLPFMKQNPDYVKNNIYSIIMDSFSDDSCFFLRELLKYPTIDINSTSFEDQQKTLLIQSIFEGRENAIEMLLKVPNIDVCIFKYQGFSPFQIICAKNLHIKIIDLFCNHPSFNEFRTDINSLIRAFQICINKANSFTAEYLLEHFDSFSSKDIVDLCYLCFRIESFVILNIIMKFVLKKWSKQSFIENFKAHCFVPSVIQEFAKMINELPE